VSNLTNKTAHQRCAALVELATGVQTSLHNAEIRIGRSRENDIVLQGDLTASRKQARITRVGDCYFLEDLASTNGTLLNGKQIHSRALLNNDDVLDLGRRKYVFSAVQAAVDEEPTINLDSAGQGMKMVSLVQSAQRMVSDVLGRLNGTVSSIPSRPSAFSDALAAVPPGGNNRFAQGKLLSGALRQYQKRKHIPLSLEAHAHSIK